jgi:tetratricopeptide (TPR) repeat protein
VNVSLRKAPAVRVVLIACGPAAWDVAHKLDEQAQIDGATVVVDENGALCEQLEVRAWPTTLLVGSDGTLRARLGGSSEVLAVKLSQYLAPSSEGSTIQTVTAGHRTQASRDIQIARDLLKQGKPSQAMALLEQLPPDALPASQRDTMRGRIYMATGQWDLAKASLLAAIAADANSSEAHDLLGQIYERDGDWRKAAIEYRTSRR